MQPFSYMLRLLVWRRMWCSRRWYVCDQSDFLFFNVRLALLSPLAVDCVDDDPWVDVTVRGGN